MLLVGCARAQPNIIMNPLAARLDSLRTAARIPGLAVVILRDTTVILARGFGFANLERAVPVTPETPFNIASVAKTISAIVALRLVERGLLDLDRPLTSYQGFAEFCADVREGGGIFFGDYECARYSMTLRHILSMTANGEPGTRFFYNPPSYSWASRPMAQVRSRHSWRPRCLGRRAWHTRPGPIAGFRCRGRWQTS